MNGKFSPVAEKGGELRNLAVRGAGATVFAQGILLAVHIVSTVILARLLTPTDFGVVTMVTTFSLLILNFGLNGFTEAVVQIEEISNALASNLFWVNLGAGILFTIGFAAAGSLLARFYEDPLVAPITIGISLTIFFNCISVLHLALLKRAMRFPALAINDIVARSFSVLVSVVLALMGWGFWALVAGAVALPFATSAGAFVLCRWLPSLPRRVPGTGSMVRFAINVYGHFSINYFARNLDNVLVGWRFGAQPLGFYKKAYDLFVLPTSQLVNPLTVVAVSALSRLKNDAAQYQRYLLRSLAVIAFVGMGMGGALTLVGKDVIRLVLGPGWEESGRIFMYFGPGIGIMLLYYTHGWIHLSIGTANRWFRWGIVEFVVTAFLFLVGLPWGPVGMALAWTSSFWILAIPSFWYAGKPINFKASVVIAAVWKYVLASILAALACTWMHSPLVSLVPSEGIEGAFMRMVVISSVFAVLYVGAVTVFFRGFEPIYQLVRLLPDMVPAGWRSRVSRMVSVAGGAGMKPILSIAEGEISETSGR